MNNKNISQDRSQPVKVNRRALLWVVAAAIFLDYALMSVVGKVTIVNKIQQQHFSTNSAIVSRSDKEQFERQFYRQRSVRKTYSRHHTNT